MTETVVIYGLGALGSAFAGLLASAGAAVAGLCRNKEHLRVIREQGLTLLEGEETFVTRFPVAGRFPAPEVPAEVPALVIVLVKSFDTETVSAALARSLPEQTPVLTLQNGLGNPEILSSHLRPDQVLAGATTFGARMETPGVVRLTGRGECVLGAWHPAAGPHLPRVQKILETAGLHCSVTGDIRIPIWRKLAVNTVINPLTALLRVSNGDLPARPELAPLIREIVDEVRRVAEGLEIALPGTAELVEEVHRVCRITASNVSSMRRDVEAARPTEIDAMSGAVARMAGRLGLDAPMNRKLAAMVRGVSPGSWNGPAALANLLAETGAARRVPVTGNRQTS